MVKNLPFKKNTSCLKKMNVLKIHVHRGLAMGANRFLKLGGLNCIHAERELCFKPPQFKSKPPQF